MQLSKRNWKPWNLRAPFKLSESQQFAATQILQDFAQKIMQQMQNLFRADISVQIDSIVSCSFLQYRQSLPNPTFFSSMELYPLNRLAFLEVNPIIVYKAINCMLGSDTKVPLMGQALNELEKGLSRKFFNIILQELHEALKPLALITFAIRDFQFDIPPSDAVSKNERCMSIFFKVVFQNFSGLFSLCIPIRSLKSIAKNVEIYDKASTPTTARENSIAKSILQDVEVTATAVLGKLEINYLDLKALQIGDILDLGKSLFQPVDLRIENDRVFKATVGLSGRFKGVLLHQVITKE